MTTVVTEEVSTDDLDFSMKKKKKKKKKINLEEDDLDELGDEGKKPEGFHVDAKKSMRSKVKSWG